MTNLVTSSWNWWLFAGLLGASLVSAAGVAIDSTGATASEPPSHDGERDPGVQLSPPNGTRVFVGRTPEIRELAACTPDDQRSGPLVLAITGLAGTGKTELAIRMVHELVTRYPDGVYWLGLRTYATQESRMHTAEALRTLLNSVGVPPDPRAIDIPALSRTWRSATASRRLLIILDDADDAHQVQPLLPGAKSSAVMVTSRHKLIGLDPDRSVMLDTLSESEAAFLAAQILERAGQPDLAAASMIAASYRLPLAVRQVTDLKAAHPSLRLNELARLNGEREADAALFHSLDALSRDVRKFLRRISWYPGLLITPEIAATLTGLSISNAQRSLAELYQRGLLIGEHRRGGYRMHDLVRAAGIAESLSRDSNRKRAACRELIFRYTYAAIVEAISTIYCGDSVTDLLQGKHGRLPVSPPQHETDIAALAWLDQNHADLLSVARLCISEGSERAWRLVYDLEFYQRIRGFYREIEELHTQALGLAERAEDQEGQAAMHQNLGLIDMRRGDYLAAREKFGASLALYVAAGHRIGQSEVHHELKSIERWLGNLDVARRHAEAMFGLVSTSDDAVIRANAYSDLGVICRLEGEHLAAREYLIESMRLFEEAGQRRGVAISHRQLGLLFAEMGQRDDGRSLLENALAVFQEIGDVMNQADTHHDLAVFSHAVQDDDSARRHADTALTLSSEISHERGVAEAHTELGAIADSRGDQETARQHWRQALGIYRRLHMRSKARDLEQLLSH